MNRLPLFVLILSFGVFLEGNGQNRADTWYFRDGQGIDFSGGSATLLTNGAIAAAEGTAAISDASGQLAFYTDGVTLWDRTHQPMPNGQGLTGDISSTQSAMIVPHPGAADLYYVFTTAQTCGPDGMRYSVVDMDLNNGYGDVIAGQKNIPLLGMSTEKLAAVHHCNGRDVWVAAIDGNSGDLNTWLVTDQGLCPCPVISSPPVPHRVAFGHMKFSNNGKYLVVAEEYGGGCGGQQVHTDLYHFDNNMGTFTHFQQLDTGVVSSSSAGGQFWGASFSPNNQVLYLSTGFMSYNGSGGITQTTAVIQYDLTASNIESTATVVWDDALSNGGCSSPMGGLQLGPDNKIYVGNSCLNYGIDVITDPDVLGSGCNYQHGVNLGGVATGSGYGITNFIESYFGTGISACDTSLGDNLCDWITQQHCPVNSVNHAMDEEEIRISPHPVVQSSILRFSNPSQAPYTFTLMDLYGRSVRRIHEIRESEISFDRGELPDGGYYFRLSTPNGPVYSGRMQIGR